MLGITLLVFFVTRLVPGGPMDRILQAGMAGDSGSSKGDSKEAGALSPEQKERLEEEYGYDKPMLYAYLQWLGVFPRESQLSKYEMKSDSIVVGLNPKQQGDFVLRGTDAIVTVILDKPAVNPEDEVKIGKFVYKDTEKDPRDDGWSIRVEAPLERKERQARRDKKEVSEITTNYVHRVVAYRTEFAGLLQGDLRRSDTYGDTVWSLIISRVPVALYFGILSTIIIYGACIPLGIAKAIGHRSWFDTLSSVLIFVGYAIPAYALGALMVVFLGARTGWFPIFGMASQNFEELSFLGQIVDVLHHTVLPLICYVISGFAMLTMLMKNSLMDNLSADYVRTAMAKGVSFRKAVIGHAFRNSFIPIATGLGGLITIFVSGSMLIEQVFDIQGFGKLQYEAVLTRDINVIMGTLTVSAFLMLLGNILSDVIVAFVDPRVKFD